MHHGMPKPALCSPHSLSAPGLPGPVPSFPRHFAGGETEAQSGAGAHCPAGLRVQPRSPGPPPRPLWIHSHPPREPRASATTGRMQKQGSWHTHVATHARSLANATPHMRTQMPAHTCSYACMFTQKCQYTYPRSYTLIHKCQLTHTHICTYSQTPIHTYTDIHIQTPAAKLIPHTHIHIQTPADTLTQAHIHIQHQLIDTQHLQTHRHSFTYKHELPHSYAHSFTCKCQLTHTQAHIHL